MKFTLCTLSVSVLLFCASGIRGLTEDELLDSLVISRTREKRVLCNTVQSNRASMKANANHFALVFGRRNINCTNLPSVDSCDYTQRRAPSLTGNHGLSMILGKRAVPEQFFNKLNRDIVFVIDDSGSIQAQQFAVAKRGAVTLANSFCPSKLGSKKGSKQVAVVLFSNTPRTVVKFSESHSGADWLSSRIQSLSQARGTTGTTAALRHVRNLLQAPGSRLNDPDTSTHVIVVTDGHCNQDCVNLKKEAELLRNLGPGVQLFALGVGRARACELDIITGNGADLAFGVSDFNSFEEFAKTLKEVARDSDEGCI